jgi:hypothetical protein
MIYTREKEKNTKITVRLNLWNPQPVPETGRECESPQGLQEPQLLADHFASSSHNHSEELFSNRPHCPVKDPLTPYPGRFCGQLLCYDDFAAQPYP